MKTVLTDEEIMSVFTEGTTQMTTMSFARAIEAAVITKLEAKHRLILEAMQEKHDSFQTSLIRANMVCLAEAFMDATYEGTYATADGPGFSSMTVRINLEKQPTIWDRMELTTDRSPDEKEVLFTVTRK